MSDVSSQKPALSLSNGSITSSQKSVVSSQNDSKLNVTFLTGEYPPMQGGIADHISYLADYMAPMGVDSSILITCRWQDNYQSAMGNKQLLIPVLSAVEGTNNQLPIYPIIPNWGWRCWPAITKFLNTHRPDILHIQYQAAAFDLGGWVNWLPWYLKKRHTATKIVTTFHDLRIPYIFPKAGSFRWKSILALARHSHAVICTDRENTHILQLAMNNEQLAITDNQLRITNYQLPNHQSKIQNLKSKIVTIPLGNNVEPQPPANFNRNDWRAKYNVKSDTLLLAYFGFLNESKGGEELIEALARLRQQGIDARLLFIGGDVGDADPTNVAYAQRVQALIDQRGLTDFVHRTGYVELPEISANLLAADAVVMPYRDGVSFRRTTLIAALQHGCPIISTAPANPALIPEIKSGKNMLLAAPNNAVSLAQTIAPLADDRKLRSKLSAGAKQLGNLFEWDNIARQTAKLYKIISDRGELVKLSD